MITSEFFKMSRPKIMRLMLEQNIKSVAELSKRAGIERATFYRSFETGASLKTLGKLADVLGVRSIDLIDDVEIPERLR